MGCTAKKARAKVAKNLDFNDFWVYNSKTFFCIKSHDFDANLMKFGASNFGLFDLGEYEGEGEDVPLPE